MRKRTIPLAAVVGHPVSHSLSPKIFHHIAAIERRPIVYKKLDITPNALAAFVGEAKNEGVFVGWNVTIPHKEAILRYVDKISDEVKAVGAANVIDFSGKCSAHNTDVFGVRRSLREQRLKLRGKSALMFGAGGAAKAVSFALGKEKLKEVWVVNRTKARASALCQRFNRIFPSTSFAVPSPSQVRGAKVALLVNATSVGLSGNSGRFTFPDDINEDVLAFDLVYRPKLTSFLTQAKRHRARTVNGLDMLLWQAIATWEIWFGKIKNRDDLKRKLRRRLKFE